SQTPIAKPWKRLGVRCGPRCTQLKLGVNERGRGTRLNGRAAAFWVLIIGICLELGSWTVEIPSSVLLSPLDSEWSRLLHIVGIWFQVLFHSPSRGSFHLSLAVLVHYRL